VSGDAEPTKGLTKFTKDVLYEAVVGITADALKWAVVALMAAAVALLVVGWTVPAWTLVAALIVAIGLMYITRRVAGREAIELRPRLEAAEEKLDRHDSYGENICSIMDNYQRVLAGDIKGVSIVDFIERGILTAGRDVMQENGHAADLRMSVLMAKEENFEMWWASGHSMQGQTKYKQPIAKTVSRIAFEKKSMQMWKNVPQEERDFEENPHATRRFKSMVSIPLLVGDRATGVFNIVTARENAFDGADVNYLTSLGAVIQTAVGVAVKVAKGRPKVVAKTTAKPTPLRVKAAARLPGLDPSRAPEARVGSARQSPEGTEEKDD
jgi:GAF domain